MSIPYLRNILLISIIAAIVMPLIVLFVINPKYNALILEITEKEATRFTQHLVSEIGWERSNRELSAMTKDLDNEIKNTKDHHDVRKVKVFDQIGTIIYSTDPSEIGSVNRHDYFHNIVAEGHTFSKIVNKNTETLEGLIAKIDLAEIYVPIIKDGEFHGAFEVYYDITATMRTLGGLISKSGWLIILLSFGLESALVFLLSKAAHMVIQNRKSAYQLKREKEFSETVLNSINEPIAIIDPHSYKLIDINEAFLNDVNLSKELVIGKYCYDITHHLNGPCDSDKHKCPMQECLKTGLTCTTRHLHRDRNNESVYVDVGTHPIKGENGRIEKIVHISRVNKEYKIAEEERRRLEEKLARSQKMEALGLLAGGVAHDLNNVLSGIVSYPDLILLDLPEASPLRGPIRTIRESGKKAAAIVQDLLTLARRGATTMDVICLNDIIEEYLNSPEYSKLKKYHPDVVTRTNLEKNLLNLKGSEVHLKKTVMNIVSNATEAMPNGGAVTISTSNQYLDNPIDGYEEIHEGEYIRLTVADNGIGMEHKDLIRVFEPFFTKKEMGRSGTGLGMSVVWGTVKDHDGYIHVSSEIDKGTEFVLYFPATREKSIFEQASIIVEQYSGKGESILVVDDLPDQRRIATDILQRLGYDVNAVADGQAAIAYLQHHTVDLVVLDMIMEPGIDGLATYKQLLHINPKQKAIIASGFSKTERVREAMAIGAGGYIKKPYTIEKLGLAVRHQLDS